MRRAAALAWSSVHLAKHLVKGQNGIPLAPSLPLGLTSQRNIQLTTGYKFDNYEEECKNFKLDVPEYFNFARDFIDQWAHAEQTGIRNTSVPALWWVDGDFKKEIKLSFQQLSQISKRVANALTGGCGLKKGDRVIVILPKIPEWWLINIACIRADLTLSPGTVLLRTKDIQHRLELSGAKCIITIPDLAHSVDEVSEYCPDLKHKIIVGGRSETMPGWLNYNELVEKASDNFECVNTKASDPMTLFFTSGTTGAPKMAEHSHASYGLGHTLTARYLLMVNPESITWNLSDPGWAKCAWSCFFAPWIHGACVFIHNAKFDPAEILQVLRDYPVTTMCCPPTALRVMTSELVKNYQLKALRHAVAGGEPVNPELIEIWRKATGLDLYEAFGQTETTLLCGRFPCIDYKPGSMGKASPGIELDIVDNDGTVLGPGIEGNLGVKVKPHRPVGLFTRYLDDPERTAAAFKGDYYLVGDRCYMDEDRYFYFVGRSDDVIISAGYRIGPFEVESALLEHPAVLESAVVSSPDEARGEVVKAFVTLVPDYKTSNKEWLISDLQQYVKSVTAPYKYPRKIEFVDELPKTVSGKIRRVELRNKEWGRH